MDLDCPAVDSPVVVAPATGAGDPASPVARPPVAPPLFSAAGPVEGGSSLDGQVGAHSEVAA
jgi:hypothetical protein